MHVQQRTANGANGVNARKVVVMVLCRGFSLVKTIALVYLRKRKVVKYGKTIVKIQITNTKVIIAVHLLTANLLKIFQPYVKPRTIAMLTQTATALSLNIQTPYTAHMKK